MGYSIKKEELFEIFKMIIIINNNNNKNNNRNMSTLSSIT